MKPQFTIIGEITVSSVSDVYHITQNGARFVVNSDRGLYTEDGFGTINAALKYALERIAEDVKEQDYENRNK